MTAQTSQQSMVRRSWVILCTRAEALDVVKKERATCASVWGQDHFRGVVPWLAVLCLLFHLGADAMILLPGNGYLATLLPDSRKGVPVQTADKLVCNRIDDRTWGFEESYPRVNQGGV